MSFDFSKNRERADRSWVPYFVLVVALLATALVTFFAANTADVKDHLRFLNASERIRNSISNRLETYTALLRSGTALFSASPSLGLSGFRSYVERLELSEHYSGIQGIGFSLQIPEASRDSLVSAMHSQGVDSFSLTPDYRRPEYNAILYMEPATRRNQKIIGFDLATEPVRRAAMHTARDSGRAEISGRVTLFQTDRPKAYGFLIFVPVYRGGGVPPTVAERRQKILGYVYSPFSADSMLSGVVGGADTMQLELEVYDGANVAPENLIFDSRIVADSSNNGSDGITATRTITMQGRTWSLLFRTRPEFYQISSRGLIANIPIAGIIISLVLFAVTRAQTRSRAEAEQIAADLRRSEEALRESESRLRRLVESNVIGIMISNTAGTISEANDAFLNLIGSSRQELQQGMINWADLTPPEYWDRDREAIQTMRTSGSHPPYEKEFIRSDGTRVPVLVGTAYLGGTEDLGVGFILDLTEQQKTQSALRSSEIRFRTIIEQSPLAVQIFSLDGQCILANRAWESLWQADRSVLKGYNILHDSQLAENGMLPYIKRAFAGELVVIPPTLYDPTRSSEPGRVRWVRNFIYPLRDDRGVITEIIIKAEDVTDRIEAELQLKLAKESAESANRAKDQFLAVLSHELRTPLTPVLTAAYVLIEYHEASDEFRTLLEIIQRNVELEARLIDDLLDLTRISNGKLQLNLTPSDAHALLRQAIEICRSDVELKKLDLEVHLNASDHHLMADSARLQQVFWNLIKNAVKFTPEGGRITVTSWDERGTFFLEVADNGIGIEPEILPKIFNAFEQGEQTITRQFGGLGLGLAISKMLVDMHGGSLRVASDGKGKGARFTIELNLLVAGTEPERTPILNSGNQATS